SPTWSHRSRGDAPATVADFAFVLLLGRRKRRDALVNSHHTKVFASTSISTARKEGRVWGENLTNCVSSYSIVRDQDRLESGFSAPNLRPYLVGWTRSCGHTNWTKLRLRDEVIHTRVTSFLLRSPTSGSGPSLEPTLAGYQSPTRDSLPPGPASVQGDPRLTLYFPPLEAPGFAFALNVEGGAL
ncbi:hypothetical protein FA13DRAFT_1774254, partial [Coprinellus micaceus]